MEHGNSTYLKETFGVNMTTNRKKKRKEDTMTNVRRSRMGYTKLRSLMELKLQQTMLMVRSKDSASSFFLMEELREVTWRITSAMVHGNL